MRKRVSKSFAIILSSMMLLSAVTGCGDKKETSKEEKTEIVLQSTDNDAEVEEATDTSATDVSEDEIEAPEGFNLVWHDEFNGTELSEDDWNREKHKVGWVNHELQAYVPSADYAYVKDGELIILITATRSI